MRVVPYIETMGSEKFKVFLAQPFTTELIEVLFSGWRVKNMGTWLKFTNEQSIILEIYPNQYILVFPKGVKYTMILPQTLGDFINDMCRFGVQLQWSDYMDKNFEPKEYLHKDEIRAYFVNLLGRMGKSHELL
jgi:hypothetical protein